jgi:hypothetical protein
MPADLALLPDIPHPLVGDGGVNDGVADAAMAHEGLERAGINATARESVACAVSQHVDANGETEPNRLAQGGPYLRHAAFRPDDYTKPYPRPLRHLRAFRAARNTECAQFAPHGVELLWRFCRWAPVRIRMVLTTRSDRSASEQRIAMRLVRSTLTSEPRSDSRSRILAPSARGPVNAAVELRTRMAGVRIACQYGGPYAALKSRRNSKIAPLASRHTSRSPFCAKRFSRCDSRVRNSSLFPSASTGSVLTNRHDFSKAA